MTGRVHVLSKPTDHPRHRRCLELLDSDDTLVLTEAALQRLTMPYPLNAIRAGSVLALEESAKAGPWPEGVTGVDHATFVDQILTRHQPVFW